MKKFIILLLMMIGLNSYSNTQENTNLYKKNVVIETEHKATENEKVSEKNNATAVTTVESQIENNHKNAKDHTYSQENIQEHEEDSVHLDGKNISLWWTIPFLGILLSIAIMPLINAHFWENNYGKISLFWSSVFVISFLIGFGFDKTLFYILETYIIEFIPFIALLLALFTVAGGIRLKGDLIGNPKLNLVILLIGTILASWMGTTGAAMLLIRPIIRANAWRRYNKHVIIFFIFLVANVGGSLTPLGDPPLFLGYLHNIDFFWPTVNMFPAMLFVSVLLLIIFFFVDSHFYKKEDRIPEKKPNAEKLSIEGKWNFVLLPVVVAAALSSSLKLGHVNLFHLDISLASMLQVGLFLTITLISILITKKETRIGNGFTWEPIKEVAKLFATIFITMVPVIAILKAGTSGALGYIINLVSADGQAVNSMYFWCTGILSSFLDNAPTYLVFFNTAGGDSAAQYLMTGGAQTLLAISCGAVFMGANTYIGNAPNFMVKSIAEENNIKMPSFFAYMVWSTLILMPIFLLVTVIFF